MVLKVDIDNVIRNMGSEMVRLYNAKFGTHMSVTDITDYDVDKSFPLLDGNAREFFFKDNEIFLYKYAMPMPKAIEALKMAKDMGHRIILMTVQPSYICKMDTLEWLELYKVPYDSLIFTNENSKKEVKADYIIDDNPKFLDEDSAHTVCVDWAYNKGSRYNYRVGSLYEFVNEYLKFKLNE